MKENELWKSGHTWLNGWYIIIGYAVAIPPNMLRFFYNSLSFDVHFTFCMFTFMSQHDLAHKLKEKAERSWLLSVKKTTYYYAFNINFSFTLLGLGVKNYIFHTEIDLQTYFFKRWQNKFSSSSQHCQISILILQNWNPCLWHIFLLFSMQILTNEQRFQQL